MLGLKSTSWLFTFVPRANRRVALPPIAHVNTSQGQTRCCLCRLFQLVTLYVPSKRFTQGDQLKQGPLYFGDAPRTNDAPRSPLYYHPSQQAHRGWLRTSGGCMTHCRNHRGVGCPVLSYSEVSSTSPRLTIFHGSGVPHPSGSGSWHTSTLQEHPSHWQ